MWALLISVQNWLGGEEVIKLMFGTIFLGEYQFCCEAPGLFVFSVKKLYFPTVLDEEMVICFFNR